MARREITQKIYNDMVRAFRERPGTFAHAARICKVTHRTAKRAWENGWPSKNFPPIQPLIEEEQRVLRAKAQLEKEAERQVIKAEALEEAVERVQLKLDGELELEASRRHAVESRLEEASMIQLSRNILINNLQAIKDYSEPLTLVGARLATALKNAAMSDEEPVEFGEKKYNQLSKALRSLGMTMRDLLTASKTAMEMERLYHGEAQQIIGLTSDLENLSVEDLLSEIEEADEAIQAGARRGLVALDGGKK